MKKILLFIIIIFFVCGCGKVQNTTTSSVVDSHEEELVETIHTLSQEEQDDSVFKEAFITITDFIFYDGTIQGKKFQDLKQEAKDQILRIYRVMEEKMEEKYPGYQDKFSQKAKDSYESLYGKTLILRKIILDEYKEKIGEESYQNMVDSYQEGVNSLQDVYDEYQPKMKEEYENVKDRFSSWYQEFKES